MISRLILLGCLVTSTGCSVVDGFIELEDSLALAFDGKPPTSYSVDPRFNDEQEIVIHEAIDHWCRAVNHCPSLETFDATKSGAVVFDDNYGRHERKIDSVAFNDGDVIYVDMSVDTDRDEFLRVVLHEWGHFGIPYHPTTVLMSDPPYPTTCVDRASAEEWCVAVGCNDTHKTTCTNDFSLQ